MRAEPQCIESLDAVRERAPGPKRAPPGRAWKHAGDSGGPVLGRHGTENPMFRCVNHAGSSASAKRRAKSTEAFRGSPRVKGLIRPPAHRRRNQRPRSPENTRRPRPGASPSWIRCSRTSEPCRRWFAEARMFARTACRTRASGSCLSSVASNAFHRWPNAVDDRSQIPRLLLPRPHEFFQRGKNSSAPRVTEHHNEPCAEPFCGKFHAADLRGRDDVSGHADDEQIAQALVEDDLCRYARVGASENDGERFLAFCELTPPRLSGECRTATNIRHESAVSFAQAFQCLWS